MPVVDDYSPLFAQAFNVEASYGAAWINLNDGAKYKFRSDGYGIKAQTKRRITTQSMFFDGTFTLHAVKDNVQEAVMIECRGASQNLVTEAQEQILAIADQDSWQLRMTYGDHRETWTCFEADYSIDRAHVNMHNVLSVVTLTIMRMPDPILEANI